MKKITYLAMSMAMFAFMSCSTEKAETVVENNSESKEEIPSATVATGKYKIKSGTIEFESSMGPVKSRKVVHFDDYGSKERVENYDNGDALKGYNTSDGKTRYFIDVESKTAWISDQNGSLGWEMKFHSWEELDRQGQTKDYTRVEDITVAGKQCEAYEYRGSTVFAGWQGLTLYQKQEPNILVEAVKLDENVNHDPAIFGVPEGFEVKERPTYN